MVSSLNILMVRKSLFHGWLHPKHLLVPCHPRELFSLFFPEIILSEMVVLYLFLWHLTLSFCHSVVRLMCRFLELLNYIDLFLYDNLSIASPNSNFCFLSLANLLHSAFDFLSFRSIFGWTSRQKSSTCIGRESPIPWGSQS